MYYFVLFLFILFYIRIVNLDNKEEKEFLKYYLPIFILLFFTFAFQYNVGTDYFSYLDAGSNTELATFKLNQFMTSREYLFALIVKIAQIFNFPQLIFIISSLIQNIFFGLSLYEIKKKNISVFYFMILYFTLASSFFTQFNAVRQFISVNLILYAVLLLIQNKKIMLGWCILAITPFFHKSSIILVMFFILYKLFEKKLMINKKSFYITCLICFVLYFTNINSIITFLISKTGIYSQYIDNVFVQKLTFTEILTKLIKLVVIFYSIYRIDIKKLNSFEHKLLNISFFSIIFMILAFSSTLLWRMFLFLDIFTIIPVIMFFKYTAKKEEILIIIIYLTFFLLVKIIIFPKREYLYNNYFWRLLLC